MHEGIDGYIVKRDNEVQHYLSKLGYIGYSLLFFQIHAHLKYMGLLFIFPLLLNNQVLVYQAYSKIG